MAEGTTAAGGAPLPQLVLELRDLVVTYVKQETIVPLRQLGRYIGFGIAGALLLGLGVVLLGVWVGFARCRPRPVRPLPETGRGPPT